MKSFCSLIIFFIASTLSAYELATLCDAPTAGILQKGEAAVICKAYRDNGLQIGAGVGLFPRFMFGVSYGGEEIVGNNEPVWHEKVEFRAKFRLIDESPSYPAFAIGVDTQGHGNYDKIKNRYTLKSKGFYLVASRNWLFLGNLGLHLGTNYSLETKDGNKALDFFAGFDKSFGNKITICGEYDLALNDDENKAVEHSSEDDNYERSKKGFLNAAGLINISDKLNIKFMFYDLLENSKSTSAMDRALQVNYAFTF